MGSGEGAYNAYLAFQALTEEDDLRSGDGDESSATPDGLPPTTLACLRRYGLSDNVSERQVAVRHVLKALQSVEREPSCVQDVFDMVRDNFSNDSDPLIRAELLEQLPLLCMHCSQQNPQLASYVSSTLTPLLAKFLNDTNTQVRKTCQAAILILLEQELLAQEVLELHICPKLLDLADTTPGNTDEIRLEAASLLCKIVTSSPIDRQWLLDTFLSRYTTMCQDNVFHIRKVCASSLGEMSRLLGRELTEHVLVPHLIALSQDTVWGVRKACAECYTAVSNRCAMVTRRNKLAPAFIVLLADPTRWVTSQAFQSLGSFISTFADSNRTGLTWIEGQLTYQDPIPSPSMARVARRTNFPPWVEKLLRLTVIWLLAHQCLLLILLKAPLRALISLLTPLVIRLLAPLTIFQALLCFSDPPPTIDVLLKPDVPDGVLVPDVEPPVETVNGKLSPRERRESEDDYMPMSDLFNDMSVHSFRERDDSEGSEEPEEASHVELKAPDGQPWQPGESSTDHEPAPIEYSVEETEPKPVASEENYGSFRYWNRDISSPVDVPEVQSITSPTDDPNFQEFMDRHFVRYDSPVEDKPVAPKPVVQVSRHSFSGSDSSEDIPLMFSVRKTSEVDESMGEGEDDFDDQDIIPQALLDNFVSMVEPVRAQQIETDISRHCAYNLPAVAFTLGRKYWPQIKPTYETLANDMQWKVRRTLAFSIHELAAILGTELTVSDLLPVFQAFLRDLDEVRIGVLRHLYDFVKLLNVDVRKTLLPTLTAFMQTDNTKNWRFRYEFTLECILLCELYDIDDINQYIAAIALTLATDKVADIRKESARLLGTVLLHFYQTEKDKGDGLDLTVNFVKDVISGFSRSQRWVRRQTFAYFCEQVVEQRAIDEELFCSHLLEPLLALSDDKIPNVRLALSRVLSSACAWFDNRERKDRLEALLKQQLDDSDRDVRHVAERALGMEPTLEMMTPMLMDEQEDSSEC